MDHLHGAGRGLPAHWCKRREGEYQFAKGKKKKTIHVHVALLVQHVKKLDSSKWCELRGSFWISGDQPLHSLSLLWREGCSTGLTETCCCAALDSWRWVFLLGSSVEKRICSIFVESEWYLTVQHKEFPVIINVLGNGQLSVPLLWADPSESFYKHINATEAFLEGKMSSNTLLIISGKTLLKYAI